MPKKAKKPEPPCSSPDALWAQLCALSGGNATAKRQAKRGLTAIIKAEEEERALARRRALAAVSPWRAVAVVLPVLETKCRCGKRYISPAGSELTRFEHRRDKSLWEIAEHPGANNPRLPRIVRVMEAFAQVCPACFTPTPIVEVVSAQGELALGVPEEQTPKPTNPHHH